MIGRVAIRVEYDGARFHGWQRQANATSLQGSLEGALSRVADAPVRVVASGRTDAGVHARGQVAHFDPPVERTTAAWLRGANANLPAGMAVVAVHEAASGFHARRSARSRTYLYRLLERDARPGLETGQVTWVRGPLDREAMAQALAQFEGRHDFSAFRASGCQADSPWRTIERAALWSSGPEIRVALRADAFLYNMVRIFMGTLIEVGRGKRRPASMADILASRRRERAGPTARPEGLYLDAVHYPPGLGAPEPPGPGPDPWDPSRF